MSLLKLQQKIQSANPSVYRLEQPHNSHAYCIDNRVLVKQKVVNAQFVRGACVCAVFKSGACLKRGMQLQRRTDACDNCTGIAANADRVHDDDARRDCMSRRVEVEALQIRLKCDQGIVSWLDWEAEATLNSISVAMSLKNRQLIIYHSFEIFSRMHCNRKQIFALLFHKKRKQLKLALIDVFLMQVTVLRRLVSMLDAK